MFIGPVDIRGTEDCIAAAVEGNGDVLVAAASPDREFTGVAGVELGKQEVRDVELVSGGQCGGLVTGIFRFVSGLCIRCGKWSKRFEDLGLGLVEHRPWRVCLRWPLMVAAEEGQCFIAMQRVRPGKVL